MAGMSFHYQAMKSKIPKKGTKASPASSTGGFGMNAYERSQQSNLHLVASIAVMLLEDENYEKAAARAYDLVETVERVGRQRALFNSVINSKTSIPFQEAVEGITGHKKEYARDKYKQFLENYIVPLTILGADSLDRSGMGPSGARLSGNASTKEYEFRNEGLSAKAAQIIQRQKDENVPAELVEMWSSLYQEWQPRKSSKGPSKKSTAKKKVKILLGRAERNL